MTASTDRSFGRLDVVLGGTLAEVLGHYRAAMELYRANDLQAALDQASYPIAGLLPALHGFLAGDAALSGPLARAIGASAAAVRERAPEEFVAVRFEQVNRTAQEALAQSIGGAAASLAFNASLVAFLTASVSRDYRRFCAETSAERTFSFHSAFGFSRQAHRMYGALEQHLQASTRARIDRAYAAMNDALPGIVPPKDPPQREDVEQWAGAVAQDLSAAGAIVEFEALPEDLALWTRRLLTRSAEAYEAGDRFRALEALAAAHASHARPLIERLRSGAPDPARRLDYEVGSRLRTALHRGEPAADFTRRVEEAIALVDGCVGRRFRS